MANNYPDITPTINATGTYEVRAPFTVASDNLLRCEAIRGIEEQLFRGIEVFETIYAANGIAFDQYERDLRVGINIITLVDNTGIPLDIPSSYITSFPEDTSIGHGRFFIILDLGILPDATDLEPVAADVVDTVDGLVGTSTSSVIGRMNIDDIITTDLANTLADARLVNQNISRSNFSRLKAVEAELELAKEEIAAKDEIIVAQATALAAP